MTEEQHAKQIPDWVREFISTRRKQLREQVRKRVVVKNLTPNETYLLCPFNEAQVKDIKFGLDKAREDRAREEFAAKASRPIFGTYGMDPLIDQFMAEHFLADFILIPQTEHEMKEALVKYYHWPRWEDEPWKTYGDFLKWLIATKNDSKDVWAINETFAGRVFLIHTIKRILEAVDFSKMEPEELLSIIGPGAENFLWFKSYTGVDEFLPYYPTWPLPANLVNDRIITLFKTCPLQGYQSYIYSVCLWKFAVPEVLTREKKYLEIASFMDYVTATSEELTRLTKALSPKDVKLINKNTAWQNFEQTASIRAMLLNFRNKYADIYDLKSEIDDSTLNESFVEAEANLLNSVTELKKNSIVVYAEGLKGNLPRLLYQITNHNLIDQVRVEKRKHTKYEKTESELDAKREQKGDETEAPFLDTLKGKDLLEALSPLEDASDLESLGINIEKLTPTERRILCDVWQGFNEGYEFDSKRGLSFRQRWGDCYEKNMKAYNRAKKKLNQR